jgi:hypothetical protein
MKQTHELYGYASYRAQLDNVEAKLVRGKGEIKLNHAVHRKNPSGEQREVFLSLQKRGQLEKNRDVLIAKINSGSKAPLPQVLLAKYYKLSF